MSHQTKEIQSRIVLLAMVGIGLVGLVVAVVAVAPLYNRLKLNQEQSVHFAVQSRAIIINEYLNRLRDVVTQVGSRTKARQALVEYNAGRKELTSYQAFSTPVLSDAVNNNEDILGLMRFDQNNHLVVTIRRDINETLWKFPAQDRADPLYFLLWEKPEPVFVISAPILDRDKTRIGTDMVIFSLNKLRDIVDDKTGLGQSGELALVQLDGNNPKSLFAIKRDIYSETLQPVLVAALNDATHTAVGMRYWPGGVMAYHNMPVPNWSVLLLMDVEELNMPVNALVEPIGAVLVVLIAAGALAMRLVLRPLAGKVIFHSGELELRVREKTLALENELAERRAAELRLSETAQVLAKQSTQLERANRELDQFAYVASHDLKAPLRAVDSLTQWLEDELAEHLKPEPAKMMKMLRARVQRMSNLIDGILQYSRIGRQNISIETVDFSALLAEVWETLAPPASFELRNNGPWPTIRVCKLRLTQVLANLIGNAIKYHDRGSGFVDVRLIDEKDYYTFSVIDDGPGIAPEFHAKVFGIFQTLQSRDTVESTGIGLSIVKKIVEEEFGQITLLSDGSRGSEFRFTWKKEMQETSVNPNQVHNQAHERMISTVT